LTNVAFLVTNGSDARFWPNNLSKMALFPYALIWRGLRTGKIKKQTQRLFTSSWILLVFWAHFLTNI